MAGIGFSLRKMLKEDDNYGTRVRAWFHTSIVAAGPWIISIFTINLLLFFAREWEVPNAERELLIAGVIYSTLFSQLLSAPFQMLITRYIADRIYTKEYQYIKPSFWGLSLLMLILSFGVAVLFYRGCGMPDEFVYVASALFILLTLLWILQVYLSTMRNFRLITFSNLLGTLVTFGIIIIFSRQPISFPEIQGATNLLLAYLLGMFFVLLFLLVVLMAELGEDNGKIFHFIRYFHAVPSLWPIGLLYTASLWIDNIMMWFSSISVDIYGVYRYAPFYDVASFYAYITILPSIMMFMVLIETDFYVKCREFFLAVIENGPLSELRNFERRMRESLFQDILRTFEVQLFVSLLTIVISPIVFPLLNVPEPSRKIFMIYSLGALCNSFILIFLQVLLYVGERNRAMGLMAIFFFSNVIFTGISMGMGEQFYGTGFFVSSFITMLLGAFISYRSYHRIIRHTFMTQPVFTREKDKVFERLEKWVDDRMTARDSFELKFLKQRQRRQAVKPNSDVYQQSKRAASQTGESIESVREEGMEAVVNDGFIPTGLEAGDGNIQKVPHLYGMKVPMKKPGCDIYTTGAQRFRRKHYRFIK